MSRKKYFLSLLLWLALSGVFAQNSQQIIHRIDSLYIKGLPKSALIEVNKLDNFARQNHNVSLQIRAVIYRITLQSYIEEDALIPIIDTLKRDIKHSVYPVQPVLQSLLAEIYWKYYQQNRWGFSQRTPIDKPDSVDITRWDLQTILNETSRLYRISLQDEKIAQQTPVDVLSGVLIGDKTTRNLRPTLYDLLINRALDFFLAEEPAITRPKMPFTLNDTALFGSAADFVKFNIKTTDTISTYYWGMRYLQQATSFHLQQSYQDAALDLDLKRLNFVSTKATFESKDSLYLNALRQIVSSFPKSELSAQALVKIGQYYQTTRSLVIALQYFNKALSAFPQSISGKNAAILIAQIKAGTLSAQIESENIPGRPILSIIDYKNIKSAKVLIYKLTRIQLDDYQYLKSDGRQQNYLNSNYKSTFPKDSLITYLKKLSALQKLNISLPDPGDYEEHSAEFKINALPQGNYLIWLKDGLHDDFSLNGFADFTVNNLAYHARKKNDTVEVIVTDRTTGKPLKGVNVSIADGKYANDTTNVEVIKTGLSNNEGRFKTPATYEEQWVKQLSFKGDTLTPGFNSIYNQNRADNKEALFRTILFSDRQVYRPGQTVYFKALYVKIQNNKTSIVTKTKLGIEFKDPNYSTIDTLNLNTNEFGTVAGSFVVPQNTLNGRFTLSGPNGALMIQVEEYKRPTFQLTLNPVSKAYKLNDSVVISGSVNAYSGYGVSQARVAYHITRRMQIDNYNAYRAAYGPSYVNNNNAELLNDTINTNSQGVFSIKFKALPSKISKFISYYYNITAEATDQSGETQSGNIQVRVSDHPLYIVIDNMPYRTTKGDSSLISLTLTNYRQHIQTGTINVSAYAIKQPEKLFKNSYWYHPDQYILTKNEYHKIFPEYAYGNESDPAYWPELNKVAGEQIIVNDSTQTYSRLNLIKTLNEGFYKIKIEGRSLNGDTVSLIRYVNILGDRTKPITLFAYAIPLNTKVKYGDKAEFLVGIGQPINVLMEQFHGNKLISSEWLNIGNEIRKISVPVTNADTHIEFSMDYQNRYYFNNFKLELIKPDEKLDIRFITYHNLLQPGQKEEWKLQVKAKNEKTMAEMVATLYDAALDDIVKPFNWPNRINFNNNTNDYPNSSWGYNSYQRAENTENIYYRPVYYTLLERLYEHLNLLGYNYYGGYNYGYHSYLNRIDVMKKETAIRDNERRDNATGLSVDTRDMASSARIQGRDLEELQATSIDKALQGRLPGVDIIASSGDPSAGTTIAIKDKIPLINIRKNFNETAFFYPQLHTNENGEILIDFTIPEALTKWRFQAFAHTKDLKTGYLESEVVTQKKLSISTNTPRFLREGDTITISARLANLTSSALSGQVQLQLFNGINMHPVTLLLDTANAHQGFTLAAHTNKAISFTLFIPTGLDALSYRLTAAAGEHTDGEENTIPVLPNRMLVTESMPMMVRAGQTRNFTFNKLVDQKSATLQNKTLTLEYTQNPAWYAVQALPYIMEFPNECSEQIFSRYYANSLATSLVNHIPIIKHIFEQWKNSNSNELLSNLEKNQELKSILLAETPWLRDAQNETEQKKRIAQLFNLDKMSYELQFNLDKLSDKQLSNGAFPWFEGSFADRYITQHIAAGIGQLYHSKLADTSKLILKTIAFKALNYINTKLLDDANFAEIHDKDYDVRTVQPIEIHAWYVSSYYPAHAKTDALKKAFANYLQRAERQWRFRDVYEQGMIALTMLRNNKVAIAEDIIRSLKETAQQNDEMGMYWSKNYLGYFWYQSPVETQCLMIELFAEAGNNEKAVDEMKIWLLRNKQTANWKTTKATAAACFALLLKGDNWLAADQGNSAISLGGKPLIALKPDVKADAATGYIKTNWTYGQIKPELGKVLISNQSKTISWGALHWQYLEQLNKITDAKTDLSLERKYFIQKQTDNGSILTAVDDKHQPKTGDLLKVVLYLKAGHDYEYLQLKDMRPAGTEPMNTQSNYKYQDGIYYYEETKDAATNFFISYLNKGSYVFEYQLRVAQPGNFSTGISTVQSVYAPAFNAHSDGIRMTIKP